MRKLALICLTFAVMGSVAHAEDCEFLVRQLNKNQDLLKQTHDGIVDTSLDIDQRRRDGRPADEIERMLKLEGRFHVMLQDASRLTLDALRSVDDGKCLSFQDFIRHHQLHERHISNGDKVHFKIIGQ